MINIKEEIEYYKQVITKVPIEEKDAFNGIGEKLEKLEKIIKLQQKTYNTLEDLIEQLEEGEKDNAKEKTKIQTLLLGIITILDLFEEIDRFFYKSEQEVFQKQFKIQRDKIQVILAKLGIVKIDYTLEQQIFDRSIHSAVQTVQQVNKVDEEVVEVLKSGYIYQQEVIRKAQVIINKQKIEEIAETKEIEEIKK